MLRDIVRNALLDDPDIAIVSDNADVVVLELANGELDGAGRDLLLDRPALKIVGISHDGRIAGLHELKASHTIMREITPAALREVVRDAAHRPLF